MKKLRLIRYIDWFLILCVTANLASCGNGDYNHSIFVESHTVLIGSFKNIAIGMDKIQVANAIFKINQETVVTPYPDTTFVLTKSNINDAKKLNVANGISLFNYRGTRVNVYFSHGKVYKITKSYDKKFDQFKIGDSTSETIVNIVNILRSHNEFYVVPIVDYRGVRSYNIVSVIADPRSGIYNYNTWKFEDAKARPAGAFYTLYFSGGVLFKIIYIRSRINIDM